MQGLRIACKRAQAGKDQAESRCAELDLELETLKAAATALRQVRPSTCPTYRPSTFLASLLLVKPLSSTSHPVVKEATVSHMAPHNSYCILTVLHGSLPSPEPSHNHCLTLGNLPC